MFEVFRVFATLGLDAGEFQNNLSDAEKRLNNTQQTFSSAGRTLTMGVSAPLMAIGAGALAVGADFEMSMNQVQALTSATADEFASLRDMAKEMGATTQFSSSEAADAMGFLAMAGQDTDQILGSMPGTLRLAAAAQMDMADAADAVTNIMAGFGIEVNDLDSAVDVLVQSFTSANTDLPQLAEAMKYAGPVANQAGVDFESAAAAIALMGNAGIQGSMAGTSLRGAITRMLNPTSKATELMREAGISFTDAEGRLRPLDEILQDLEPHADDAGLFMELFGQRAGPAMAALVSQGSDALTELTQDLHDSGGRAQEVADVQMEGLAGAMRLFKSASEAVLIAIADSGLLEAATNFLTLMAGWIQNLSEVNPMILRIATILGGLLAALGPVLWAVGSFAGAVSNLLPLIRMVPGVFTAIRTAMSLLMGPVGIIIAAVGALVWAFSTDFLGIRTFVVDLWHSVVEAFKVAGEWIGNFFSGLWDTITSAWDGVKNAFSSAGDAIKNVFGAMRDNARDSITALGQLFTGDFRGAWDTARGIVTRWWDTVDNLFGGLPGKMLEHGRNLVGAVSDGARQLIGNVTTTLTDLGNTMLDRTEGAWNSVKNAYDTATTWLSGTFNTIRTSAGNLWTGIRDRFTEGAENTRTAFSNFRTGVSDIWTGVRQSFTESRQAGVGVFESLSTASWEAVQAIGRHLGIDFRAVWDTARTTITDWWNRTSEFFRDLPSRMLDFGRDLVTGLADGIRDSVTNAVEAVTGLGSRLLDNFKGLLGISSPSKVFHGFGLDVAEGLATGIEDGTPRAVGAVNALGQAVSNAVSTWQSGSGWDWSTENIVGGFLGDLEGQSAVTAMQDRITDLGRQQRMLDARGGSALGQNVLQWQINALEEGIQNMTREMRGAADAQRQAADTTRAGTARFSLAVDQFDSGVRGYTLAAQRY